MTRIQNPETVARRTVGEWALRGQNDYGNPFADVVLDAVFTAPSGEVLTMPGFYDGDGIWRIRFNPGEAGTWHYRTTATPADPGLEAEGTFEVTANETRGFLRSTPGEAWGFTFESGAPAFLVGDTVYNLIGMAMSGGDVDDFLRRRAEQGFGLLRVRLQVSPFHGPKGYSEWQTVRTWPWGGSEQAPQFDRFNLDVFHAADRVIQQVEALGLGLELIMEAWGFEFPFNDRSVFVAEWEDLWLRYLIARYDAYRCVYIWTLQNEYEYYPDGDWRHNPIADRWAMRRARWVKTMAPHGHIVAVHNGPRLPPFAERFKLDLTAVDTVMFQSWGSMGDDDSWLAAGIEDEVRAAFAGWPGSAIFAEWGYERNPDLPLNLPHHKNCSIAHTRRGAWRGAFCALNLIHGWENSWGPFMILDEDQPGMVHLLHVRRFFTEIVPFDPLQPAQALLAPAGYAHGYEPLVLASPNRDVVAVYFPAGGVATLKVRFGDGSVQWYDPRTGTLDDGEAEVVDEGVRAVCPDAVDAAGHPQDWVLVLRLADVK